MDASLPKKTTHGPRVDLEMPHAREAKRQRESLVAGDISRRISFTEQRLFDMFETEFALMTLKRIFWDFYLAYTGAQGSIDAPDNTWKIRVVNTTHGKDISIYVNDHDRDAIWTLDPKVVRSIEVNKRFSQWLDHHGWRLVADVMVWDDDTWIMVVCMKGEADE